MSDALILEALEELLAEKRAKEAAKKGKYPTAAALVMARMMKRIAVKYADLDLAREASSLHKQAISALKKKQSALSSPPETNSGEGTSTTKSEKRVIAGPSRIDGESLALSSLRTAPAGSNRGNRASAGWRGELPLTSLSAPRRFPRCSHGGSVSRSRNSEAREYPRAIAASIAFQSAFGPGTARPWP